MFGEDYRMFGSLGWENICSTFRENPRKVLALFFSKGEKDHGGSKKKRKKKKIIQLYT